MANSLTISILVILFFLSAVAAARTKLYSMNGLDGLSALSPSANEGICKLMVEPQRFVCQEHTVTTQDGYILSLQRMPVGKSGKTADKPPVLLQHGLMMDGITWLLNQLDESLAFILADNGFDVWIANNCRTRFSRQHTSLSPNDPAYWDWSWDELVAYDLTATCQYVHEQTGQKLHYVGHSLELKIMMATSSWYHAAALNMIHLAQMVRTGTIAMYDYGNEDDNMDHYGQLSPPAYNLTSIPNNLPVFLGYGGKDMLSDVKDMQVLLDNLKDHDGDKLVVHYRDDYAHADFVFGVNANRIICDPLMAFLRLN